MTFQVRLYLHHDNDLIQLYLNGIRLSDVFAKSLEAHYKKEDIRFEIPVKLELKPHKGKVYRIKVTLDEMKQPSLVQWVRAFPDQYKCHCIKNIARTYLGSSVIDALNGMAQAGIWMPDDSKNRGNTKSKTVRLKEWKKKEDGKESIQWIDQVSATRKKTTKQKQKMEKDKERICKKPIEEILGTRPADFLDMHEEDNAYHTIAGKVMTVQETMPAELAFRDDENKGQGLYHGSYGSSFSDIGFMDTLHSMAKSSGKSAEPPDEPNNPDDTQAPSSPEEYDDFDVSLLFEQLRTQ